MFIMPRYKRPINQTYPNTGRGIHVAELKEEDFLPSESKNEPLEEALHEEEVTSEQIEKEEEHVPSLERFEETEEKKEELHPEEETKETLECNQMDENPEDFRRRVATRQQMQQQDNISPRSESDEPAEEPVMDMRDTEQEHNIQRRGMERRFPNHAMVRILNAAAGYDPVFVIVGNKTIATNLAYGKISQYERVQDGFRTVIVYSSVAPRTPLLTTVLPFISGQRMTLAVVNTARGLQIVPMLDNACDEQMYDRACFRVANLTFDDGPFDVSLSDGTVVFTDINVKEVTPWKQAIAGDYEFYVSITPVSDQADQQSRVPFNPNIPQNNPNGSQYLFSFYQTIVPDTIYTACIVGGYYAEEPIQVIIIEN